MFCTFFQRVFDHFCDNASIAMFRSIRRFFYQIISEFKIISLQWFQNWFLNSFILFVCSFCFMSLLFFHFYFFTFLFFLHFAFWFRKQIFFILIHWRYDFFTIRRKYVIQHKTCLKILSANERWFWCFEIHSTNLRQKQRKFIEFD